MKKYGIDRDIKVILGSCERKIILGASIDQFDCSDFVLELVEWVPLREVANLQICWAHEGGTFVTSLEVLLVLDFSIRVARGLIEEHTNPVASTKAWNLAVVFDRAATLSNIELTPLVDLNRLSLIFHEVFIHALALGALEALMSSSLHSGFESTESIVTLVVISFADLVLLHLAHIIEFVCHVAATLIDHMHCEAFLRLELTESLLWVHKLPNDLALSVLQLQAHVSGISTKLALKELLNLLNVPVQVHTELR